jgi:hypothetical protein
MQQFEELAERLLRGGVSYRHVKSYVAELRDHYDDALRSETASGKSSAAAHATALARLGSMDDLAHGMIARPELRALSARFPRLLTGAAPVVLWIGILVLAIFAFAGAFKDQEASAASAVFQAPTDASFLSVTRVVPIIIGALMLTLALRQRLALTWPLIGAAVLAALAGTTDAKVFFSTTPDKSSEFAIGNSLLPVFSSPFTDTLGVIRPDDLATGLLWSAAILALSLSPLLLRKRLTPPVV